MTFGYLTPLDLLLVVAYFIGIIALGIWSGGRAKSVAQMFVAERQMPWWAVFISFTAAAFSALSFIGKPGQAYAENMKFFFTTFGNIAACLVVGFLFVQAYHRSGVISIYEWLGQRFGTSSQRLGAVYFLVTRLLASAVRVTAIALALDVILQIPIQLSVILVVGSTCAYVVYGGLKSVIWTDVVQFTILITGIVLTFVIVINAVPGGLTEIIRIANDTVGPDGKPVNKLFLRDFWTWVTWKDILVMIAFAFVTSTAAYGCDQDMMQRLLSTKNGGEALRSMLTSALVDLPMTGGLLFIGVALYAYAQTHPGILVVASQKADYVFPEFIAKVLPSGFRGMLVAALFSAAMGSTSAAINALASSAIVDFYRPLVPGRTEEHYVFASRAATIVSSIVLAVLALLFSKAEGILWLGFKLVAFTYGGLLGIFLVGLLTRRGSSLGNLIALPTITALLIFWRARDLFGQADWFKGSWWDNLTRTLYADRIDWQLTIVFGVVLTFAIAVVFPPEEGRTARPLEG
ncbi:MAG: sodium/solute symporter [Candidatus Riflebacteria bacterium]|nr:sodium/solute symporter [Candidatus Riflebacteria bacterium]